MVREERGIRNESGSGWIEEEQMGMFEMNGVPRFNVES